MKTKRVRASELKEGDVVYDGNPSSELTTKFCVKQINGNVLRLKMTGGNHTYKSDDNCEVTFNVAGSGLWHREVAKVNKAFC